MRAGVCERVITLPGCMIFDFVRLKLFLLMDEGFTTLRAKTRRASCSAHCSKPPPSTATQLIEGFFFRVLDVRRRGLNQHEHGIKDREGLQVR